MATSSPLSSHSSAANQLELQILLTTTSGRYIFHHPATEDSSAPTSLLTTLAAAFTAFTHTTHSIVRTIQTGQQTLQMISSPPLLLAITTPTTTPTPPLKPLMQLLISAVYTATSRSLHTHLLNNPTAPTGKIAALVGPLLRNIVASFSRNPLPVYLSLTPTLSSPIDVSQRQVLQNNMRDVVKPKREFTHALLVVENRNGSDRTEVLLEVFREGMRLSWLDHALLSCADEDRLFLPTTGFHRGLRVRRRSLKLADASRQEVKPSNLATYTLLVLGTWSSDDVKSAENALDDLESLFSHSGELDDMQSAVHRTYPILNLTPRNQTDFFNSFVKDAEQDSPKAMLMLGRARCVGTDCAYDPSIAAPIAKAVSLAQTSKERVVYASGGLRVIVEDGRYVTVFAESVPHEEAENFALEAVKWMKRYQQSLLPLDSGACVPHNTPLAGFIAPFAS